MDQIKCRSKLPPKKAMQPEVSGKAMEGNFICVFRERDLLRNHVHSPPVKSSLGILLDFFKPGV